MDRPRVDPAKVEAFLDRFVGIAAGTTTIALLTVADRSGLLAWLGKGAGGTPSEIAAATGLDERYVREVCSGLAAGGVLEHEDGSFSLPPEHALFVADPSSPYFMGGWLDMLPAMVEQIDGVADAVRHGGGVPFEAFGPGLIRGLDRANGPSQRILLIRKWLPAVPGLIERLEEGSRVADIGCGTGTVAIQIATTFPNSSVVGFDVSDELLSIARERAAGVPNVTFERVPVSEIPTTPGFDLITSFDVIHDLVDPLGGLHRIREALAPGGCYLMMEPNASSDLDDNLHDHGTLLYGISTLYCMTQSLAEGGAGLGAAWGRQQAEALAGRAGFSRFEPLDAIQNRFSSFYLLS